MKSVFSVVGLCYMLGLMVAMLLPDFFIFNIITIVVIGILVSIFYECENKISVLVGMLFIGIGIFSYTIAYNAKTEPVKILSNKTATVTAIVTEKYYTENGKCTYTLQTVIINPYNENQNGYPQKIKLKITTKSDFYAEIYENIKLDIKFSEFDKFSQYSFHSISEGCYLRATVISAYPEILEKIPKNNLISDIRIDIEKRINTYFNKKQSGLLYALLIGDKSELDYSVKNNFRNAGISHIIVISGLHLSIIVNFLFFVIFKLTHKRKFTSAFTICVILFYVILTDFQYSVIRSAIMNIIYLMFYFLYKKPYSLNSLGFAGLFITLINPLAIGNLGLLMSFSATLGIISLEHSLSKIMIKNSVKIFRINYIKNCRKRKLCYRLLEYLANCISVSLSATVFTLPVVIFVFERFSIYFLLSNLIVTAVAPIVIVIGFLIVILSYIPIIFFLNIFLIIIERFLLNFIISTAEKISSLPNAVISLNDFYVKISAIAVIIIVIAFFILEEFYIKEIRKCIVMCISISAVIISAGYLITDKSVNFCLVETGNGITLLEKSSDHTNILLCGGDKYHFDDVENLIYGENINSMFIFGDMMYYGKYARNIAEEFDVKQIITYNDGTQYKYISDYNNISQININGRIYYDKYYIQTITVNDKNYLYINIDTENDILILAQNGNCNDIPDKYRDVNTAVVIKKCENTDIISAENVILCNKDETLIINKLFNGGISIWQN